MTVMEYIVKLKANIDHFKNLYGYVDGIEKSLDILIGVQDGTLSVDIIETFYESTVMKMKVDETVNFRIFYFVYTINSIFLFLIKHNEERLPFIKKELEYLTSKFTD